MGEKELFIASEEEISLYRADLAKALLSKRNANPKITIFNETPFVLRFFGYEHLAIKTDKSTILKVMGEYADKEHNVSREAILNLPELIKNPLAILILFIPTMLRDFKS